MVVSSIGMVLQRKGWGFGGRDAHICENGTKTILSALSELEGVREAEKVEEETRVVVLSTTGISERGRDIPLAMVPMYHWMLAVPHADKKRMEKALVGSGRRWVAVRPSFLLDGDEKGVGKVRVGVEVPGEEGKEEKMEVGYVIHREDVAGWIFEECVRRNVGRWEGKMVSLTY